MYTILMFTAFMMRSFALFTYFRNGTVSIQIIQMWYVYDIFALGNVQQYPFFVPSSFRSRPASYSEYGGGQMVLCYLYF